VAVWLSSASYRVSARHHFFFSIRRPNAFAFHIACQINSFSDRRSLPDWQANFVHSDRTTYSAAKLIQLVVSCLSALHLRLTSWLSHALRSLLISLTKLGAHAIVTGCLQRQSSTANTSSPWQTASVKGESPLPGGITSWWRVPFPSNTQSACPSWSIVMEDRPEESPKTSALALFHS
jgi:hypothetical protein